MVLGKTHRHYETGKHHFEVHKLHSWKNIPIGGIIEEAGNSIEYKTADWRTLRPVHIPEQCTDCMICWYACPDSCILPKDGKFDRFLYTHCKGCGVCAEECPTNAISMKETNEFKKFLKEPKCFFCQKEFNREEFVKDENTKLIFKKKGDVLVYGFVCSQDCLDKINKEMRMGKR